MLFGVVIPHGIMGVEMDDRRGKHTDLLRLGVEYDH